MDAPQLRRWVEDVVGRKLKGSTLAEGLADGVALCDLAAKAFGVIMITYDSANVPYKRRRENLQQFLDACQEAGITTFDIDSLDRQDTSQVVPCLIALSKKLGDVPDLDLTKPTSSPPERDDDDDDDDDVSVKPAPPLNDEDVDDDALQDDIDDNATAVTVEGAEHPSRLRNGGCLSAPLVLHDDDFLPKSTDGEDDDDISVWIHGSRDAPPGDDEDQEHPPPPPPLQDVPVVATQE